MGSTQLLPGASAQGTQDPQNTQNTDGVAAEPDQKSDRSLSVSSDQAMVKDRSLDVPAVSNARPDTSGITGANQVPVQLGRPSTSNQLTSAGQDRGQLAPQRLEGNDACDDETDGSGPDICANPLETRAGEFAGTPRPQLSAEQRLLAQQYATPAAGDTTDGTARRLAAGRNADLSNDDLAIASVVTSDQAGRQPPASETGTDIPADATNAIDVILGVINASVPE